MNEYQLTREEYEKAEGWKADAQAKQGPLAPKLPQRCHFPNSCFYYAERVDGNWYCSRCGWPDPEPNLCSKQRWAIGAHHARCQNPWRFLEMTVKAELGRQKFCGLHSPKRLKGVADRLREKNRLEEEAWRSKRTSEEQAADRLRRTTFLKELGFTSTAEALKAAGGLRVGKQLEKASLDFFLYLANWRDNEEILEWPHFKDFSSAVAVAQAFFDPDCSCTPWLQDGKATHEPKCKLRT